MSVIATKRRRSGGGFSEYLLSRGSTFAFTGFLMTGLTLGSIFCISGAESAELMRAIVQNNLDLQLEHGFIQLFIDSVTGFAGIFIFIYLCVNSRKGAMLIYIVPLLHGLSVGSVITTVLTANGYGAISYVLLCVFVPKLVETLLLLSVCNKTARYCKVRYSEKNSRHSNESFPIMLYFVVFGVYFVVESMMVYLFRGVI